MKRIFAFVLVAVLALLAGGIGSSNKALAHEHRAVGNYEFVVGWLNEPALAYEPNGLDLRVTFFPNGVPAEGDEAAEAAGQPVAGLEETLDAEIIAGGGAQTRPLALEPAFGEEGAYESPLIPTVPGDYTFHVSGKVQDMEVDETFTSGPETFSVINEPSEIQFPEQLAAPASASDSNSNGSSDDTARVLGIIGIIAGIIGVAAGGVALASRRS